MKTVRAALFTAVALVPFTISISYAQDETALSDVVAEGDRVQAPVRLGTGVDSGTTRVETQDIQARSPGSGDVNELLRIMPSVDFSRADGVASRDNIQDLRPADITIAGGQYYENLVTLDGIGATSRVDVTNTSPQNGAELAGPSSQMLWLDSELIGSITLRDSNISAEYGNFSGGVLELKTRDPRRSLGVTGTFSYSEDGLTEMVLSDWARQELGDGDLPMKPQFNKRRYGGTIDMPLGDRAALMASYNRSEASVVHYANPSYGNTPRKFSSVSENVLVRGIYDIDNATKLTGQFTYSPYSSESSTGVAIESTVNSKGGGYAGKLELERQGDLSWKVEATYTNTDTGRTANSGMFVIPNTVANGAFCSSSSCTRGGIGNLDQNEEVLGFKGQMNGSLGDVLLRGGVAYEHVSVDKVRAEASNSFAGGVTGANIVCVDGDSLACVTGQYALTRLVSTPGYSASVDLDSFGAWAEAEIGLGALTIRPGLRYDYESFLGNHVFAPRFAVGYELPWEGWEISLGANRYYGMSMVSYALRSQYPTSTTLNRSAEVSGGLRRYSDSGWVVSSISNANQYANGGLDTPYSDELTASLAGQVFEGTFRIKGIYRNGGNAFMRSPMQRYVEDGPDGSPITRRYFEMTNDGWSRHRSLSLEWMRSFGKHGIGLSVNYARTKTRFTDYFEDVDDLVYEPVMVLFNGQATTTTEIASLNRRGDYGAPLKVAASWTAKWLDDRLTTSLTGRFQTGFRRIEDTGATQVVDGVRYDVYDWRKYGSSVDFDLNVAADVIQSSMGTLTLDLRISNLLNSVPDRTSSDIQNYQFGRAAWIGMKFRY